VSEEGKRFVAAQTRDFFRQKFHTAILLLQQNLAVPAFPPGQPNTNH
jgi:hypothetical protein